MLQKFGVVVNNNLYKNAFVNPTSIISNSMHVFNNYNSNKIFNFRKWKEKNKELVSYITNKLPYLDPKDIKKVISEIKGKHRKQEAKGMAQDFVEVIDQIKNLLEKAYQAKLNPDLTLPPHLPLPPPQFPPPPDNENKSTSANVDKNNVEDNKGEEHEGHNESNEGKNDAGTKSVGGGGSGRLDQGGPRDEFR